MLKRRLEILFNFYCKIVKNYTGILNKNYKALIFIFMICLTSFFFRVEVLDSIPNNLYLQYMLLYGSMAYILFIKVNTGFRLVITFMKGIPYYLNEIKIGKVKKITLQFIGFIILNVILILFSVVV